MGVITWNEVYNVGVSEIDTQHKELISIINELYDAQKQGLGQIIITNTLLRLCDYTVYHFTAEEEMHHLYKYPEANNHKLEHGEFVSKLDELRMEAEKKNLLLTLKTLDFLKDWTINHILGTDKQFGEYLRKIELR